MHQHEDGPVITLKDLGAHNTKEDAWIAIRGKVFDITFYIGKHPGGEDPLLNKLGKDGTDSFNNVHSYVDFETILTGHFVGYLEGYTALPHNVKDASTHHCCCFKMRDTRFPTIGIFNSKRNVIYEVSFKGQSAYHRSDSWIVGLETERIFTVLKMVDSANAWYSSYALPRPLPFSVLKSSFKRYHRTLDAIISHPEDDKQDDWKTIGFPEPDNNNIIQIENIGCSFGGYVVYKKAMTPDVSLYGIRLPSCASFGVTIGHHVMIDVNGVKRPYTPVCYSIFSKDAQSPADFGRGKGERPIIWFIIKVYPAGELTPALDSIPLTKERNTDGDEGGPEPTVKISNPQGHFDINLLFRKEMQLVILLAGGTGITPMAKIIHWAHERYSKGDRRREVVLLFWVKTEGDIIWRAEWERMEEESKSGWFSFVPILTAAAEGWKGLSGRVTTDQIEEAFETCHLTIVKRERRLAFICGSRGFNKAAEEACSPLFASEKIVTFEG